MAGWTSALARTRKAMFGGLTRLVRRSPRIDAQTLEEWEEALIQADIPPRLVGEWLDDVRHAGVRGLEDRILERMRREFDGHTAFDWDLSRRPTVVLIVGVNGSGKTTTAAKLAHLARKRGLTPILGAADTFRAAGSDQLRIWAERVGCDAVGGQQGSDGAAVAFDTVKAAVARKADIAFVDSAGRMHTRQPLMQELQKVSRSLGKALDGAPHETWIVLDASIGHNAVVQARTFHEAVGLTGIVVAKLDGSSKAGFILSLARELEIPMRFAGLGEAMDDLEPFDPDAFTRAIVGSE
jgi:fused signal recognition particle receptor